MTLAQLRADQYFANAFVPQPAVMPLNGVVTSAADLARRNHLHGGYALDGS